MCYIISICIMQQNINASKSLLYVLLRIILLSGLFIAVTTPTKIGGIYMIIGSSVTQLLLSGKRINF